MKPLVSILIPAYNAEEWIADTIRSAMAQTWEPKEIVIVDDGSSDRTYDVAKQFASETVRVYRHENQGPSATRNKAFSLCRGEYIQWLDADDLLAPDKVETQMRVMPIEDKRTLLSSAFGAFIYRPHKAQFVPTDLWCDLSPAEFMLRKMAQRLSMQTSTWLVSRELTEAAGPWDTNMHVNNDGEYFCRVLLACDAVRFVPEAKVYYRAVGSTSVSYVGKSNKKMDALWRSMQLHIDYLRSLEDTPRVREGCVQYLQHYLITFFPLRPDIVEQMHRLAGDLGGKLTTPRLSWKYAWIKTLFGWDSAQHAQIALTNAKASLERIWDKTLSRWDNQPLVDPQAHA